MDIDRINKDTKCVYRNVEGQGVNVPIYTSTAYEYIGYEGQTYPRNFNTHNQEEVAKVLSKLEHAETGLLFSSGMAAISTALFTLLQPEDHVILFGELYGEQPNS